MCGKKLPEEWLQQLAEYPEIHHLGFLENIDVVNAGVDALIHPGTIATGIKTKLVEALAQNTTVITTYAGARGIPPHITSTKLICVPDHDPMAFAKKIMELSHLADNTPNSFYAEFYWGNIAKQAHTILENVHGRAN